MYHTNLASPDLSYNELTNLALPAGLTGLATLDLSANQLPNFTLPAGSTSLTSLDLASMRESLEVRVPMLDEELFEFAMTLLHAFKVKGRLCKRVLRAVAGRVLPRGSRANPNKDS
jgi:hypothetical protein